MFQTLAAAVAEKDSSNRNTNIAVISVAPYVANKNDFKRSEIPRMVIHNRILKVFLLKGTGLLQTSFTQEAEEIKIKT